MIPMIALSLPDITLDTLSNPVLRRIRFWPIDIPCTLPGGVCHLNQIGAPVNLFLHRFAIPYLIASSMCSISVKTTGPSPLTRTSSSSLQVCRRPGCPAKVSTAKYMFSLISAG